MDTTVQELFSEGIAPATRRNYRTGERRYLRFCDQFRIPTPFPASERVLQPSWPSYSRRSWQRELSRCNPTRPDRPRLRGPAHGGHAPTGVRGERHEAKGSVSIPAHKTSHNPTDPGSDEAGVAGRPKPICCGQQPRCASLASWKWSPLTTLVLTSASHLAYRDVKVDSHVAPHFLNVRIKASKTDPFRKGVSVFLGRPDGATLDYMVRRGPGNGPLFSFADGRFLTRDRFVVAVRGALTKAGHYPSQLPHRGSNNGSPEGSRLLRLSIYGVY